jgi:hypothetical protein
VLIAEGSKSNHPATLLHLSRIPRILCRTRPC